MQLLGIPSQAHGTVFSYTIFTMIDLIEFLSMIIIRLIIILYLFNSVCFVSKECLMPRLGELSAEKGADTDQRVLEAYQMQCVAEAQEG